ncbi:hypothetical protein [Virgibacillus senegalensis]|nr:hypothetical protein [Virgibacillus senegalensis]
MGLLKILDKREQEELWGDFEADFDRKIELIDILLELCHSENL